MRHPSAITRLIAVLTLCAGVAVAGAAQAQSSADIRELNARIDDLESQIRNLRADSYAGSYSSNGGASAGGAASTPAQLFLRLDTLEAEMRRLTGEVEQLGYRVTRIEEDQRQRFEDMEFRLLELEGIDTSDMPRGGSGADVATPAAATGAAAAAGAGASAGTGADLAPGARALGEIPAAGGAPAGGGDDEAAFQAALNALQRGDSDSAERAFRAFAVDHPNSARGGEARFWMGEISYARSEYQQAARMYLDVQQNYPDDRKAPDALLKLGMSLARMGQSREACLTLREVPTQYPTAGASVLRGAEIEGRRLGCGF